MQIDICSSLVNDRLVAFLFIQSHTYSIKPLSMVNHRLKEVPAERVTLQVLSGGLHAYNLYLMPDCGPEAQQFDLT